jgi:hypothetical protein
MRIASRLEVTRATAIFNTTWPPRTTDTGVHFAKNFGAVGVRGSTPLILGVWGKKGCGKSFNVELCCLEMGVTPVIISAGELEVPR